MYRWLYLDGLRLKIDAPDFLTLKKNLANNLNVKLDDILLIFNGTIINNEQEYGYIKQDQIIHISPRSDFLNIIINCEDVKTHLLEIYDNLHQSLTELLLIETDDAPKKYQLIDNILSILRVSMNNTRTEIYHQKSYQLLDKLLTLLVWYNNLYLIKCLNDSKINTSLL